MQNAPETIENYVKRLIAAAPPLTHAQRDALSDLLAVPAAPPQKPADATD